MTYVPLHLHSEYSLLDGAIRFDPLMRRALEMGLPALALTDHGNMHGAVEFYHACKAHGIKPIVGCELYVAPGSRYDKAGYGAGEGAHHLVALARDMEGYRNLMRLSTLGYLEGFYYKPRVDKELLRRHAKGLVVLSGCLQGEVAQALARADADAALRAVREFQGMFGEENFYLEVQDHGLPEQKLVNRALLKLSQETGAPLAATNDCHYLDRADAEAHELLLCVQTAARLDDPKRFRFPSPEFYLKDPEAMARLFAFAPGALENTLKIAARCDVELTKGKLLMPGFTLPAAYTAPEGQDPTLAYLSEQCEGALVRRWGGTPERPKAEKRLEAELAVIGKAGFAGYFLIVRDFIAWARAHGVRVGPGRGSAAGSLVAYLLGITALDPLEHGLLFERFLNPERLSPPDIDVDFADRGRDLVIGYVMDKYGRDNVAQIATFNTLGARAALRDTARVMGVPVPEVEGLLKLLPDDLSAGLADAEGSAELKALLAGDTRLAKLWALARRLEGLARNTSVHAAGVVLCPEPLVNHVPLGLARGLKAPDEEGEAALATVTQYPMESLEKLGLIKMDLLGLRTLTVIDDCLALLPEQGRPDVDLLPDGDEAAYAMLARGDAHGVFQLESAGMRDLLRRFKPRGLKDLNALIALYRPGAMEGIDDFLKRRLGEAPAAPPLPEIGDALDETYGLIVYQEQVMQIAVRVGGFSLAQADLLRRAMGKKDPDLLERQRDAFVRGAAANHVPADKAGAVFDLLAKFGGYGFNKSHSAAYALLAYQTAWLKANHPAEYMCALLTSEMGSPKRVVASMAECRRLGLKVLPPDVNASGRRFELDPAGAGIRFSLAALRHVGEGLADAVLEARRKGGRFTGLMDLLERVEGRWMTLRALESLAKAGALDSLLPGQPPTAARPRLLAAAPQMLEAGLRRQRERESGQFSLFGGAGDEGPALELPKAPAWPEPVMLGFEKEVLGFFVSGHPLDRVAAELAALSPRPLAGLEGMRDGERVTVAGLVVAVKTMATRRQETMARATLEDVGGVGEAILWPSVLAKAGGRAAKDAVVVVRGRIDASGEAPKVAADEVLTLAEALEQAPRLHVRMADTGGDALERLRLLAQAHPGQTEVWLYQRAQGREVAQRLGAGGGVKMDAVMVAGVKALGLEWRVTSPVPPSGAGRGRSRA